MSAVFTPASAGESLEMDSGRALDGYFRDLRGILGTGRVDAAAVAEVMRRHDTRPVE